MQNTPALPYPISGPYEPAGMYRNPNQTIPFPSPSNTPVGYYDGGNNPLFWTASSDPEASFEAKWGSPLFDLRPDLRGAGGTVLAGTPIWKGAGQGIGGKLWVQVMGLRNVTGGVSATENLRVYSQEFGHITDSTMVASISTAIDVTEDFFKSSTIVTGTNGADSAPMAFSAPGEGYPMRYWRIQLIFKRMKQGSAGGQAAPVGMSVSSAYY